MNKYNKKFHRKCCEWEGLPVKESMNIEEFYQNVAICELKQELWNKSFTAYFSHTKIGEKEKIGPKCNAWENC